MSNTFGKLFEEADSLHASIRLRHSSDLENIRNGIRIALSELHREEDEQASSAYKASLAMWLRAIEACQATLLLLEYGFIKPQFSTLRTAYECLFVACGLWRGHATLADLEAWHDTERVKQAGGMYAKIESQECSPEVLEFFSQTKDEHSPRKKLNICEVADKAGLGLIYESSYRGLSIAGAHASLRSLDNYFLPDPTIAHQLDIERVFILKQLVQCISIGMERQSEAREKFRAVRNRSVSYTPSETPDNVQTK